MRKVLSTVVGTLGVAAMATVACAFPQTQDMDKALSEVTNQQQHTSAKPAKKHSGTQKQQKTQQKSKRQGSATSPPTPYHQGQ